MTEAYIDPRAYIYEEQEYDEGREVHVPIKAKTLGNKWIFGFTERLKRQETYFTTIEVPTLFVCRDVVNDSFTHVAMNSTDSTMVVTGQVIGVIQFCSAEAHKPLVPLLKLIDASLINYDGVLNPVPEAHHGCVGVDIDEIRSDFVRLTASSGSSTSTGLRWS